MLSIEEFRGQRIYPFVRGVVELITFGDLSLINITDQSDATNVPPIAVPVTGWLAEPAVELFESDGSGPGSLPDFQHTPVWDPRVTGVQWPEGSMPVWDDRTIGETRPTRPEQWGYPGLTISEVANIEEFASSLHNDGGGFASIEVDHHRLYIPSIDYRRVIGELHHTCCPALLSACDAGCSVDCTRHFSPATPLIGGFAWDQPAIRYLVGEVLGGALHVGYYSRGLLPTPIHVVERLYRSVQAAGGARRSFILDIGEPDNGYLHLCMVVADMADFNGHLLRVVPHVLIGNVHNGVGFYLIRLPDDVVAQPVGLEGTSSVVPPILGCLSQVHTCNALRNYQDVFTYIAGRF